MILSAFGKNMECIAVGKIAQRFVGLLLKHNDCLKSQTLSFTTTFTRCDKERDNNKFQQSNTAHEGHNNTTNRIYQASCARLVFSTTTAATDRPVYQYFINWKNHSANQQPTFTRHNRFYCTVKNSRKKMVRIIFYFFFKLNLHNFY